MKIVEKRPKNYHRPAERATLGTMIRNPALLWIITLPSRWFYYKKHQQISECLNAYGNYDRDTNQQPDHDPNTLIRWVSEYAKEKNYKNIDDDTLLEIAENGMGTSLNLMRYLYILSYKARCRDDNTRDYWVTYDDYLSSKHWKEIATYAKQAALWRCAVCGKSSDGVELHGHHRTYERLTEELPEDITVLCKDCHSLYHEKKKVDNSEHLAKRLLNDLDDILSYYNGVLNG